MLTGYTQLKAWFFHPMRQYDMTNEHLMKINYNFPFTLHVSEMGIQTPEDISNVSC